MVERLGTWVRGALVGVLVWVGGCEAGDRDADIEPWPAGDASYDFERPDAHFELAGNLEEISGLAVLENGTLAAIQDEDGILFILDPASGAIVDERPFGPSGDYEAVSVGAGYLFVLESGGRLYRIDDWGEDELDATEFTLDLPRGCDAEGLRYDAEGDRLLVVCKENAGSDLVQKKAIYAFDVDGRRLSEAPAYALDTRTFSVSIEDHPASEAVRAVLSERVDLSGFKPSDLAFHPVTGELFVISSVRKALVSLSEDGAATGIWRLPDSLLDQPEGMDFGPNGDLYISSEAGDRPDAVLLRFDYRNAREDVAE